MFHPKVILRIIGLLLQLEALFLSCSLGLSLYLGEEGMLPAYLYTLAALVGCGLLLTYIGYNKERNISRKDGYIVVNKEMLEKEMLVLKSIGYKIFRCVTKKMKKGN